MFPWLMWSPSYYFPLSGAVTQDIETDWFDREITSESGDANIEKEIFRDVASYGTQIGILNEAVLALAEELKPESLENNEALKKLNTLQENVKRIKSTIKDQNRKRAKQMLDKLAQEDPDYLVSLLESYKREIQKEFNPISEDT